MSNNPFSTSKGKMLADKLVREIGQNEPYENYDEVIDYVREELCSYSDNKAKAPISAFIRAEDERRLRERQIGNRYNITIGA